MNEKLILNSGLQIGIERGSSLSDIKVMSDTKQDMVSIWDMLMEESLKHIEIQAEDGTVVGIYENILLENETSTIQPDGKILTSFHLREKTEVEILREEVSELKAASSVHDGAIGDLATAVSDLAEEGGLA